MVSRYLFEKVFSSFVRVIADLRIYQQKQYQLLPQEEVRQFLEQIFVTKQLLDDNACYKESLVCEPRQK
jgi:hypothetical protein